MLVLKMVYANNPFGSGHVCIHGSVLDALSKRPIMGAKIAVDNGTTSTLTNAQGKFMLMLDAECPCLSISHPEYNSSKQSLSCEFLHMR